MGVTNRNEVHYKKPDQMSSTESLHIPISSSQTSLVSTTSNENIVIPLSARRRKKRNIPVAERLGNSPPNAGRRRQRRYKAVAELTALIEEDESEIFLEDGIPHNSPFTTILENPELEEVWEHFTAKDETEQAELLDKKPKKGKLISTSYINVSYNVKMIFKVMRSLNELEKHEMEIVDFFTKSPGDTYINKEKSSFQRLLIHGIAQYYRLKSTSFNAKDGSRIIKVENPQKFSEFCNIRLYSIVQDNHKNRV